VCPVLWWPKGQRRDSGVWWPQTPLPDHTRSSMHADRGTGRRRGWDMCARARLFGPVRGGSAGVGLPQRLRAARGAGPAEPPDPTTSVTAIVLYSRLGRIGHLGQGSPNARSLESQTTLTPVVGGFLRGPDGPAVGTTYMAYILPSRGTRSTCPHPALIYLMPIGP
jgi:hypothetical protein